ncbi:PAS domain-containing protein [bacterium]|nr:PAS domain-containing protein [bacterium]
MEPLKNHKSRSKYPIGHALFIIPIPIFVILLISLRVLGLGDSVIFDPPGLLPFLNMLFLFMGPVFVSYLAAKGYLESGSFSLIVLGSAVFSFALGSLIAGFLLPAEGPNDVITVHNVSACMSGILHFTGTAIVFIGIQPEQDVRKRKRWLVILYSVVFALLAILTFGVHRHILPTFFIQGQGPTLLRQIVLGGAVVFFFISGLLFGILYKNDRSSFSSWYMVALFLIAMGLGAIFIQKSFGSPIGWLGRIAQYLGGLYMITAVLIGFKEEGATVIRFEKIFKKFFRNRFEDLLAENTIELLHVNNQLQLEKEALRESEKHIKAVSVRYQTVADFAFDWETWTDPDGKHIYISPSCERISGYKAEEFIEDPDLMVKITHPDDQSLVMNHFKRGEILKSPMHPFDFRINHKNGETVWISHACRTVNDSEGNDLGRRGSNRDITDQKKYQKEIEKYAETQALLLNEVNHRVKNNLTAIISMLHNEKDLIKKHQPKLFTPILKRITGRVESLSVVHSLLSAKEWSPLNLSDLCEEIIYTTIKAHTGLKKSQINVTPSPVVINSAEAHHLGLVINELTTNSLKFAKSTAKNTQISVDIQEEKNRICFSFRDNGLGYPDEIISKEYQAEGTGLTLINGIVTHSLGGDVYFSNEGGAVTQVIFEKQPE